MPRDVSIGETNEPHELVVVLAIGANRVRGKVLVVAPNSFFAMSTCRV
ncbi:hypothetical protein JQ543_18720 [Bradyrhizobium diazoefficiens]|nr:hypothetical protein [Bradyrhizobium diazoefficiens]MBR0849793.1 hypothetical protein [Bradyrhizobium diazoefficiens]